jgi:mannose/fructose/N-acetylgalactosamine-specific phosphotransferase system component IIC
VTPASLLAGAAVVALLELDAASIGQLMISRPAVFGPAFGALYGQPTLGTLFGVLWELLSLDAPIGGHLPINATAGAGASLLLSLGPGGLPPQAALPCGIAAGWAHRRLELYLRKRRAGVAARCERRMSQGRSPRIGAYAALELLKQFACTFAVVGLFTLLRPALAPFADAAPDALRGALQVGLWAGPWIGLAALLRALRVAA